MATTEKCGLVSRLTRNIDVWWPVTRSGLLSPPPKDHRRSRTWELLQSPNRSALPREPLPEEEIRTCVFGLVSLLHRCDGRLVPHRCRVLAQDVPRPPDR